MPNHNINLEAMEISFPCASPAPFPRMTPDGVPYLETLQITPEAVDLSRLNGGASILKNHDPEKILGTCLKAWIENDQLWVRAKFRQNDPDSVAAFRDIADGTLRNVSVGYEQQHVDFSRKKSDTIPITGEVVRWLPLEVSVEVGIPADPTVGFYRSYNIKGAIPAMTEEEKKDLQPIGDPENEEQQEKPAEEKPAEPAEKPAEETPSTPSEEEKSAEEPAEEEKPAAEEEKPAPSAEEAAIRSIASAYGAAEAFIARALAKKMTPAAFAEQCRKADQKIFKKGAYMPKITTTERFDFSRAIRAAVEGTFNRNMPEFNMSQELFRSVGKDSCGVNTFMMPFTRDFTGAADSGGAIIGTELRGDLFSEFIGNKLGVKGYQSITGLKQNITIPVQTAAVEANITKFNTPATKTDPKIEDRTLSPKRITAYTVVGRDLLLQGVPSAENIVINDIGKALAKKTDIALLKGLTIDSTNKITGVLGTEGLSTVTIADMTKATWTDMTKFAAAVEGKDYSGTAPAWVGSAADKATFKTISKDEGSGRFIMEDNQIDGYDYNVDGNVAAGDLVFGYWDALTLAQWGGLEIIVDSTTLADTGMVRIIGNIYIDACVRYPELFVKRVAE